MTERAALVYRAGAGAVRRLPEPMVDSVRRVGSRLAAHSTPERRFLVARHLRRAAGHELRGRRLERMIDDSFDHYARYWIDSARLSELTEAEVDAGFSCEGFNNIEDGWATGVGPILVLPHLGGWEWAGRWLTVRPRYEVSVVVEPLEPAELFEWMVQYREAFGMNVIALGAEAGRRTLRALKNNHVTCLLSDRDIGGGGIEVDFFGEPTTLPAGPATLALRTGAAIVPVAVYHADARHHAVVRPPVRTDRTASLREDIGRITQAIARELELLVRAAPDQWHLMQPNWPSDHAALADFRAGRH